MQSVSSPQPLDHSGVSGPGAHTGSFLPLARKRGRLWPNKSLGVWPHCPARLGCHRVASEDVLQKW